MYTIDKVIFPINEWIYTIYNMVKMAVKQPRYKKILKSNGAYRNKYRRKRCFILGNGPSLKNVDFSLLKDEYTFTVNHITRNADFQKLHTNFHMWTDPKFFEIGNPVCESKEYIDSILAVNSKGNQPVCFVPTEAKEYLKKYKIDQKLNINYINLCLTFHDSIKTAFDFTKLLPGTSTVVINAIMLAVFMGFGEVYLLGCDSTGIIGDINKELGIMEDDHAYAMNQKDYSFMKKNFEESFQSWANIFHQYKWIAEACRRKKVKLKNCTEHSILNVIEFQALNDIVQNKY